MVGRVKKKQRLQQLQQSQAQRVPVESALCALCHRPLGARVEWHHPVPKNEGGTRTVRVHPICHRAIHAHLSNHELARNYADMDVLRGREDLQRFLKWIAKKPADFHAPTRQPRVLAG